MPNKQQAQRNKSNAKPAVDLTSDSPQPFSPEEEVIAGRRKRRAIVLSSPDSPDARPGPAKQQVVQVQAPQNGHHSGHAAGKELADEDEDDEHAHGLRVQRRRARGGKVVIHSQDTEDDDAVDVDAGEVASAGQQGASPSSTAADTATAVDAGAGHGRGESAPKAERRGSSSSSDDVEMLEDNVSPAAAQAAAGDQQDGKLGEDGNGAGVARKRLVATGNASNAAGISTAAGSNAAPGAKTGGWNTKRVEGLGLGSLSRPGGLLQKSNRLGSTNSLASGLPLRSVALQDASERQAQAQQELLRSASRTDRRLASYEDSDDEEPEQQEGLLNKVERISQQLRAMLGSGTAGDR